MEVDSFTLPLPDLLVRSNIYFSRFIEFQLFILDK